MVSDAIVETVVHQSIGDIHSPGEDLIEVTTHYMGDSIGFESTSEVKVVQFTVHVGDVIVKVTTHHNCSFRVLLDDILMISVTLFALSALNSSSPGSR